MFQPWVESLNIKVKINFLLKTLQWLFILYGSVVPGVFRWCYAAIPLVFCCVPLVFRVMFSCSATVPECSAVPPVFDVPLFRVPAFLFLCYAVLRDSSQCLLLNTLINVTRDIFQFAKNGNTKNEQTGITRKKIWSKSKKKEWAVP